MSEIRYTRIVHQMLNKSRNFGFLVILFFVLRQGIGQQYFFPFPPDASAGANLMDSVNYFLPGRQGFFEQFRTEMELERFLILNLSPYIDPNRFFVSIRFDPNGESDSVSLSDQTIVMDSLSASDNSLKEPFRPPLNRLPGLPEYWERNKTQPTTSSNPDDQESISDLGQEEDDLDYQDESEKFLLGKLSVHFIIDPDITPEVQSLMEKMAFYALKLYAFESYEITFERISMNDLFSEEEKKTDPDSLVISVDNKLGLDKLLETELQKKLGEWWFLWVLILLLLLIVVLFFLWNLRKPVKAVKQGESRILEDPVNERETIDSTGEINQIAVSEKQSPLVIVRDNFHDYFVRHTPEIGKVFSYWIEDFGAEGLLRVHTILMPMGKNMYTLLFPYLSKKATELLLKSFYKQLPSINDEERNNFLEKLFEIINYKLGIDSVALLASLEKEELFSLLDLLEENEAAKALYHLEVGIRSEYLEGILPFRAAEILVNVASIRWMSKSDYDMLGELISAKLVELRFFKKYQKKDLHFMLETLESIDLDVQEMILENLKSSDEVLYHEIKKSQLYWSDLPNLDKELVREATLLFSPEELSIAYKYRPEELASIILLRPERERELIFQLSEQKDNVSEIEAKSILKRLLIAIKTKIQANEKKD